MSFKQVIKTAVPAPIWSQLRRTKDSLKASVGRKQQARRYSKWISQPNSTDKVRVETRLAFDIHRLEKGLSHQNFRYGFGKHVLEEISLRMQLLEQADTNYTNNRLYLQGLSVLHEYQERHEQHGYDLSQVQKLFPPHIWKTAQDYNPKNSTNTVNAGSMTIFISSKKNNTERSFIDLAKNRYSVREYSSTPVSQELLNKVYEVAMKTPSVCNRQATRIYEITDPDIISKALHIQGGFTGYKNPPVLLLVTSDIRAFMNDNERNEPFVDGGLFAMSLLYSLEAYGLAACPLNAMFDSKQDKDTRKLLQIPDYEFPIMYIAIGNFPETVPVCISNRKSPQEIVKFVAN